MLLLSINHVTWLLCPFTLGNRQVNQLPSQLRPQQSLVPLADAEARLILRLILFQLWWPTCSAQAFLPTLPAAWWSACHPFNRILFWPRPNRLRPLDTPSSCSGFKIYSRRNRDRPRNIPLWRIRRPHVTFLALETACLRLTEMLSSCTSVCTRMDSCLGMYTPTRFTPSSDFRPKLSIRQNRVLQKGKHLIRWRFLRFRNCELTFHDPVVWFVGCGVLVGCSFWMPLSQVHAGQ